MPGDPEKRSQFARRMMAEKLEDPEFEHNLIFFDEAHFHLKSVPNRQNSRTWATDNRGFVIDKPLHSPRVTALIGVGYYGIVGPYFFDNTVNSVRYLEMLKEQVLPELRDWPNFESIVFVQDGAAPHWAKDVRAFLNQSFPNRWIGRDSPFIAWPPRSPDLTPMDFFIWGHLKGKLYKGEKFANLKTLMANIEAEAAIIDLNTIQRCIANFWERLLKCEMCGGLSVETVD